VFCKGRKECFGWLGVGGIMSVRFWIGVFRCIVVIVV